MGLRWDLFGGALDLKSRVGDPEPLGERCRIVDLLAIGDASSSKLSATLGLPSHLLAHHLKSLEDAGLLTRHRSEGDGRRTYLSLNRHEVWVARESDDRIPLPTARRVLFVCTANTARSHLAAALWRQASPVAATSAGTHPGERVAPGALATARRPHLDLPEVAPRLLADTLEEGDLVITVCDRAHEELDGLAWAHWSIPDPVPDGSRGAFEAAHDALVQRVGTLATRVARAPGGASRP